MSNAQKLRGQPPPPLTTFRERYGYGRDELRALVNARKREERERKRRASDAELFELGQDYQRETRARTRRTPPPARGKETK